MKNSSFCYRAKMAVALLMLMTSTAAINMALAQNTRPLVRYACTNAATSSFHYDDIKAEKSDGYCDKSTRIEIDVSGAEGLATVTADRRQDHSVQIDVAWVPGKTGIITVKVYYYKRIYRGLPKPTCRWTSRRDLYTYEIHRESIGPGGKFSGPVEATVAGNDAVSVFNLDYTPTISNYLESEWLQATKIRYFNGIDTVETPIEREGLSYIPTPVTYHATGKGTFVMQSKVYGVVVGEDCGRWYSVDPVTLKVFSSCYKDDVSNVTITPIGPGAVRHPEDGSFTVEKGTQYALEVTNIEHFSDNFTWRANGGNELTLTGDSFVVHQDIGSYRIEAIPNDEGCPIPPALQILTGGQNTFIKEPCTITLPDYFTKPPYNLSLDNIVFRHFATHVESNRGIVVMPGVTLDMGAELMLKVLPDSETTDLQMNFTQISAFDEYGQLVSESRSYFDDSGRPLQTQYKNITAGVVLADATLYDAYGRAAIATLPAPVVADASRFCPADDRDGRGMLFGFKPDFVKAATNSQRYDYTHFDLANELSPAAVEASTEGTLGWYYSANNGNAPTSLLHEPLVATTQYPYSRTLFHHDGSGNVNGATKPGDAFKAGSPYLATSDMQAVAADDPYLSTGFNSYLSIRERDLLLPRPASIEGRFFKTVLTDESGKKSITYTDKAGQTIISLYFGTGTTPITKSYQFYDLAGRLLVSISPNGLNQYSVDQNNVSNFNSIDKTRYFYNNKGWLMAAEEKIAGQELDGISRTEYLYRKDGSIRFSQNHEQRKASPQRYSYTNYDKSGRPVESGEFEIGAGGYGFNSTQLKSVLENTEADGGLADNTGIKRERQFTRYDEVLADVPLGRKQRFVHGSVSRTQKDSTITSWYSYDERGRVEWMIQDIAGFGIKTVDYRFGPTGQVQEITYQRSSNDERFSHFYEYDQDGRLHKVYTTRQLLAYNKLGRLTNTGVTYNTVGNIDNPGILEHQATYSYYLHGPLKRVELSTRTKDGNKVTLQGLDYTYTIDGALKSINHADPAKDPGGDGTTRPDVRADVFGLTLDYYAGDYLAAKGPAESITIPPGYTNQYTGLIKATRWHSPIIPGKQFGYAYTYDQRNQFLKADWGTVTGGVFSGNPLKPYYEAIGSYDANGNIGSLQRNTNILKPASYFSHNLAYSYKANTNMLDSITQTQGSDVETFRKYQYNDLGQMTQETQGDTTKFVRYDVTGKVTGVYADAGHTQPVVTFTYDDRGFRLSKVSYDQHHQPAQLSWYVRDASGSILGTYEKIIGVDDRLKLSELPVYGSGRIGLYKPDYGLTLYELADHLGNVRAVIGGEIDAEYIATMETERRTNETPDFENLVSSPAAEFINHTPAQLTVDGTASTIENPNEVLRMNNRPAGELHPNPIGTGIMVWVHPGDVIDAEVFVKYANFNASDNSLVGGLSGSLYTVFKNTAKGVDLSGVFNIVETPAFAALSVWSKLDDTQPKAFLNYLLFDNDFQMQENGFDFDQVSSAAQITGTPADHERLFLEDITIQKEGFLYIYVSNQSDQNMDVYFDDLHIKHSYSDIVAGGDYYPFGLPIKDRQITRDYYRHGYQGKFSERDEETGWNHFELREYDPVIGRWLVPDPAQQHSSPYLAMGNNPIGRTDMDGSWDGYQSPSNAWERFWNWASGHNYLNNAHDYLTNTPSNEIIKSVAYLPGGAVFIIDKLDEEGNVRFSDHMYAFVGDEVYQMTFDTFFDRREELGMPTGDTNGMTWAGMGGWIKKGLYSGKLAKNLVLREKFVQALKNGLVGPKGMEGIKELTGPGIKVNGVKYSYELKVLGKGVQHPRLLGNKEPWINPRTKEKIDIVIFRVFQN